MNKSTGTIARGISNHQSISEKTYHLLKSAILSGELEKGEKINEKDLASRIGISRTPIREALKRLEYEELIESIPRRYYVVVGLTLNEAMEIVTIRAHLEQMAIKKTVPEMTSKDIHELEHYVKLGYEAVQEQDYERLSKVNGEFHEVILQKNQRIIRGLVNNLKSYIIFFRSRSLEAYPSRARKTVEEHEEIVQAIKKQDGESAGVLMHQHIENGRDYIRKGYSKNLEA